MANKPSDANFFPDVPVYPKMGTFQPVYGKFDLTTYIQGASDYEIMAFLVGKYNACLEAYGTATKLSTDTITACKQLQDWINSWFDNLDVQEELNNKIDSMVQDGSFGRLLHQTFDAQINQNTTNTVTQWLVANVTPTGSAVVVDKSLSIGGAAADAKVTGELKEDLAYHENLLFSENDVIYSEIGLIDKELKKSENQSWNCLFAPVSRVSNKRKLIEISSGTLTGYSDSVPSFAFYDSNKNIISGNYENPYNSTIIHVPDGAVYVVFNSSSGAFSIKFESMNDEINFIYDLANETYVKADGTTISGYGIYKDGIFYSNSNAKVKRLTIKKGMSYRFNSEFSIILSNYDNPSKNVANNNIQMTTNHFDNITDYKYLYFECVGSSAQTSYSEVYAKKIPSYEIVNTTISEYGNGIFYFYTQPIKCGDTIYIKRTVNSNKENVLFFSDEKRTDSSITSQSISFTNNEATVVATRDWNGFTSWSDDNGSDKYKYDIVIKHNLYDRDKISYPSNTVIVSASNSSIEDKIKSHFVCDGINDEVEINLAIDMVKRKTGKVILCDGDYYIDKFNTYRIDNKEQKVAICTYTETDLDGGVSIEGCSCGKPQRAIIHVKESAFNALSSTDEPSVFSGGTIGSGYHGGFGFNIKHIKIELPNTQHKCVAINYQHLYWGVIDSCTITAKGYGQDVVPIEGLVGVRGWAGWSDGSVIGAYDTYVSGFRVGFQLGGEHVICERLGARFCYTSYTFGEYPLGEGSGAQVHPITLINCCDEHQATLPKFYNSGNADSRHDGRCCVDFISFNIEHYPLITGTPIVGAMEEVDGGWVGRIDYTIENDENNSSVNIPFWANGHGKNFRTTNSAQLQMGTTSRRNFYAPNYMQQYYDSDLNKIVYCIEPSTNTWIDANGNEC